MLITDYEKHIQEKVDKELTIVPHSNTDITDIKIVLWRGFNISIVLPPLNIFDKVNKDYKDFGGSPYRTVGMADRDIKSKLKVVRKKMKLYETVLD